MTVSLVLSGCFPIKLTYKVESSSSFGGAVHVLVNSWRCLIPLVFHLPIFFHASDIFLGGEKHDFSKRNQLADYQPNVNHLHVRGGWQALHLADEDGRHHQHGGEVHTQGSLEEERFEECGGKSYHREQN